MRRLLFVVLLVSAGMAPTAAAQGTCTPGAALPGCQPAAGPEPPPGEEAPPQHIAPGGTPCDVVRSKGRGTFVGLVAEQIYAGTAAYRSCALSAQARAGVRILRQTLRWNEIEYAPGQYSFTYFDEYVRALAEHRIELLPILFDSPAWRSARPLLDTGRGVYPPRNAAEMGEFAARVAERYGSNGSFWGENPDLPKTPVRSWQVWNEPNFPHYWLPAPNAKEYVGLQRAVATAIRKVDPRAQIVTAGLPHSTAAGAIPLTRYVTAMYKAGGRGSFDILAVNGYARTAKELIRRVQGVRKVMRRHRDRSKIWVTEVGWATQGPPSRYTTGPARQARLISGSFKAVAKQRRKLRLAGLVYYNWQDQEAYPGFHDFWGLHTGLLEADGTPKPSLAAFSKQGKRLRKVG